MKNLKLQRVPVLIMGTVLGVAAAGSITPSAWNESASALAANRAVAAAPDDEAKAAIQKQGEAFVEAFHKGDAKALAALFALDCDHVDRTGAVVTGRDAIENVFKSLFAGHNGVKVRIESNSLRFLTPDVAVEDGTTEVFPPDGGPSSQYRFTNIHVKKDGKWLLGSVRAAPIVSPGNYEHLRALEWAIGDWAGVEAEGVVKRLAVAWADNQNFINATFSTSFNNLPVGSAVQRIGWDPAAKRLRSWIFDGTGGFGEGSWVRDGQKWVIKTTSILQDGKKSAATYILTPVDSDTVTLQAIDRTDEDKKLPDGKEVKLKRVK